MPLSGYLIGIDFGTSNTVGVLRYPDGRSESLLFDGSPMLLSGVCLDENGQFLTGRDAAHVARTRPEAFEPNPKRRIDDGTVLLGGHEVPVPQLLAAVLSRVMAEARRAKGRQPEQVVLTHPVAWGPRRLDLLRQAAAIAGIPSALLVPEPVAAAYSFVALPRVSVAPGQSMVVYDFGGGTFDATVVRRTPMGFDVVAYQGLDDVGGLDVDAAIFEHLGVLLGDRAAPVWERLKTPMTASDRRESRLLWEDVRQAKETLSRTTSVHIHVPLLDDDLPLGREQLDALARPLLNQTVGTTLESLRAAETPSGGLAAVLLVGGSSRIPLVSALLHEYLGIAPTVVENPELVVAQGAIIVGAAAPVAPPMSPPVSPPGVGAGGAPPRPGRISDAYGTVPGSGAGGTSAASGAPVPPPRPPIIARPQGAGAHGGVSGAGAHGGGSGAQGAGSGVHGGGGPGSGVPGSGVPGSGVRGSGSGVRESGAHASGAHESGAQEPGAHGAGSGAGVHGAAAGGAPGGERPRRKAGAGRIVAIVAAAMVLVLVLCGGGLFLRDMFAAENDSGDTNAYDAGAPPCAAELAFIGASTGDGADLGLRIRNGVELAVADHNAKSADCAVTLTSFDTAGDEKKAAEFAANVAGNPTTVGVVGPLRPAELAAAGKVYDAAGLAQITPVGDADALAQWKTFHQVIGDEDSPNLFARKYLVDTLKATKVYLTDDGSAHGRKLAGYFRGGLEEARAWAGSETVSRDGLGGSAAKIIRSGATAVVYVGAPALAGQLRRALTEVGGRDIRLVGTSEIDDPAFFTEAGDSAAGTVLFGPYMPEKEVPAEFRVAYAAKYGTEPGRYAAEAYDAATIMLDGIAAGKQTRKDMLDFVNRYDADGLTKRLKFNELGDLAVPTMWLYEADANAFTSTGKLTR
ncbi:Hsp70 family protein [Cryptosporangium arvum]|uniref:Hsp70 family protein n=1 Tax=Cryptosporangium arvum TaxID=80871 RepID=UPI0004AF4A4C|nr:Hsp70 family protein [Cryptosporangium arvum]